MRKILGFFEKNKPTPLSLPSRYLPSPSDVEDMANYLVFMTCIDHRAGAWFEDVVDGEALRGAELLWKLGEIKWRNDPSFFKPSKMATVSLAEVEGWLTTSKGRTAKGPRLRAQLLRDTARWLLRLYGGRGAELVETSRGSYARLVELLRPFKAFNDPVAKKAYLLAKLLAKSGLMRGGNPAELRIPVDNHVARVSLRLGLVKPMQGRYASKPAFDVKLRLEVREAWSRLVRKARLDPTALDDLLWMVGRALCRREGALCTVEAERPMELAKVAPWAWRRCPLEEVCLGFKSPLARRLKEPLVKTWWY